MYLFLEMDGLPVKCNVCEEYFHSLEEMNDHLQRNHALINRNKRFQCDFVNCNATFNNRSSLRSHKFRKHRVRVPYQNVLVEPNVGMDGENQNVDIEDLQRGNVDVESRDCGNEEDLSNGNYNIREGNQNVDVNGAEPNVNIDVHYSNDVIEDFQRDNINLESRTLRTEDDSRNESDSEEFSSSDSEADEWIEEDTDDDDDVYAERKDDPRKRTIGLLFLQLRATTHMSEEKISSILQAMQDAVKSFNKFF